MDHTNPTTSEEDGEVVVIRRNVVLGVIIAIALVVAGVVALVVNRETDKERFERRQECEYAARIGGRSTEDC